MDNAPFMDWAFTQSPFALAIHDRDLLCLRVNDRMCQMFGLVEDELRGRRLTDVLHGPQYDAMEHYMRQVLDTGEPMRRGTRRRVPGETRERAWSVAVSPLKDQAGRTQAVWIGVLDITEQYGARQRLTLLNEAGTQIGTTLDVTRTAEELADMVVPRLADLAIVDLLDAVLSGHEPSPGPLTGTVALRRVAHQSIFEGVPEAVVKPGEVDIHPESFPAAQCLATGKAVLTGVNDLAFMSSIGNNPARAATIRKFGIHSVLSVPIRARGVTLGVATFLQTPSSRTTCCSPRNSPPEPPFLLTTPGATPASGPPPWPCSAACCRSDSPGNRRWRSPAATCPPVLMPAWAGTGSM